MAIERNWPFSFNTIVPLKSQAAYNGPSQPLVPGREAAPLQPMIPVSEKAKVPTVGTAETAAGISDRLTAARDNQNLFMGSASGSGFGIKCKLEVQIVALGITPEEERHQAQAVTQGRGHG